MHKKFLLNLGLLFLLNLLVKPLWIFGIDLTVQNRVGPEVYGFYYALLNFSYIFNIFLDFGITNFNNRNIAQNAQLITKHVPGLVILRLMLGALYIVISGLFGMIIGYSESQLLFVSVLCINQFFSALVLYLRSNLSGLQLFKTDSLLSVLDKVLMIIFCAILLQDQWIGTSFKIIWFVLAQSVSYIITALIAITQILTHSGKLHFKWEPAFYMVMLKKTAPFALLGLLMVFYTRVDSVMLERMLPDGELQAGIYAQGFRLLEAFNMVGFLTASLLLPMFSKQLGQNESISQLLNLSYRFLMVPVFILFVGCYLYRKHLMDFLYTSHSDESAPVFGLLMASFLFVSSTYVLGTLLTANGSLRQLNYLAFGCLILNIILNFVLIPTYKAYGAALASLFTNGLNALGQVLIVMPLFSQKLSSKMIFRSISFLLIFTALAYYIANLSLFWFWGLLLIGVVGVVLALLSGLIGIQSAMELVKKRLAND